ncbi:MAG: tRNA (adenosine(37)-N6)-threonylcarbamoyltransferase complex ATPase subunit type 1 TsaE [Alphaproteobacteria bacterium]
MDAQNFDLEDEAATMALAQRMAPCLRVGHVVALEGDLGAGKTAFCRALIRDLLGNSEEPVPSPTFALVQTYEGPDFPITHFDLYRLKDERELDELGFFEALDEGVTLIEWPDRAGRSLPHDCIRLSLTHGEDEGRRIAKLEGINL